ncbi:hypothetical protein BH11CYA1_BH11CYA1_31480 [soil metagenome]
MHKQIALALGLIMGLVNVSEPCWAGISVDEVLLSPVSLTASAGKDGQGEIATMLDRVRHLKGYVYDSVLTTYVNGKPVVEIGKLYFKSPNLMRFEVVKSGSKSGAVVVRQADGKIRGQMGGMFRGIKLSLSPDSKILKSANGFSIMQSDLDSLLSGAAKKAKGDLKCLAVAAGSGRPAVVELIESDGDVKDRIAVDERAKLPSEWNIFNSAKIFSALQLNNVQVRTDLPDELFTLNSDADAKELVTQLSPDTGLAALAVSSGRPVDVKTCKDINRVMKLMEAVLERLPSDATEGDAWASGARESLLATCVDFESLQYCLKPVGDAIVSTTPRSGIASEASDVSGQWNRTTASCRTSVEQLIDQLTLDKPDGEVVKKTCSELKANAKALRAISERIENLI